MESQATESEEGISRQELQLATRNHGMPLEALRYAVTPVGLHYLLTHYDIPDVDVDAWRLDVGGALERSASLSLDDIRARPPRTVTVTLECAGNGRALLSPRPVSQPWIMEAVGTAEWTGVSLAALLEELRPDPGATDVIFTGLDRGIEREVEQSFERGLPLEEAMNEDVILAHTVNGQPLPPQHGFPLRLVVPGWYGMASVKWLSRITVSGEPFAGHQNATAYRMRFEEDQEGTPLTRISPRSLMIPPGIPEFMTRVRHVEAGRRVLRGRAWSGWGPVARVEVSTDGGDRWSSAYLESPESRYAWTGWSFEWHAGPGEYELCSRATDGTGRTQPLQEEWNVGGYANNAVQRIPVVVTEPSASS